MKTIELKQASPKNAEPLFGINARSTIWAGIGFFLTIVFAISDAIVLGEVRPFYLFSLGFLCATTWILIAPLIRRWANVVPVGLPINTMSILIHIPVSIIGSLGCTLVFAGFIVFVERVTGVSQIPWWMAFRSATFYFLLANAIYYWLVVVVHTVSDYSERIRITETRALATRRQLAEAKTEVLRMQMQPHFLFNSLNSVNALIGLGKKEQAISVVAKLGEMLRTSFQQNDSTLVPLREEIEMIENYVDLETIRFGDRLRVSFEIDQEIEANLVPKWILQPVVENAIRHGIDSKLDAGNIKITAYSKTNRTVIEIVDDGVGIPDRFKEGVGLGNTRKRLQGLFESEFALELNRLEDGSLIRLEIPVDFEGMES